MVLVSALGDNSELSARVAKYGPAPYAYVIRRVGQKKRDDDWSHIEWLNLKTMGGRLGLSAS